MNKILSKWFYPKINYKFLNDIKKIVDSNFVNEGPFSKKFEKKLALKCKRKYCAVTSSGSTALLTALLAIGVKKNDEVFIPGFSFIATANAIKIIGAKPVWVDIDASTMCISHDDLSKKINKRKKIPKYLVTVEVNGYAPDYKKIISICNKFKIKFITDSAESLGSRYNKKPLGSYGAISTLSFSPNKIITTGQGGAVLTDDKKLYKDILAIKYQGNHIRGDGGADTFYRMGLNFKLSDINCALGLSQINSIDKRLNNTEKNSKAFEKTLKYKDVFFPKIHQGGKKLWIDCLINKNRFNFINFLKKNNIGFREFWLPMNKQKSMFTNINLKNVELVSKKGFWLVSNFDLSKEMIFKKFKIK